MTCLDHRTGPLVKPPIRLLALRFALLALATGCLALSPPTRATAFEAAKNTSTELGGAFTLVDHNGQTVTDKEFRGKWLLVFFGYTHCPDACPTALSEMAAAIGDLDQRTRAQIKILFITVDPERDTPRVMKDYVEAFETPNIIGLTGTAKQLGVAEAAYRIHAKRHGPADGDYTMSHTSAIHIMNPEGRFAGLSQPDQVGERLAHLMQPQITSFQ